MRPPGQVGRDAPVVAMEVRAHAAPGVGVDAAPVDEHERRPGAPLPVLDRPRRDVDEAAFAELSADRHRFAFRASAGQLLADVERGAPLWLDAGDPEVLHRPGDPAREAVPAATASIPAAMSNTKSFSIDDDHPIAGAFAGGWAYSSSGCQCTRRGLSRARRGATHTSA